MGKCQPYLVADGTPGAAGCAATETRVYWPSLYNGKVHVLDLTANQSPQLLADTGKKCLHIALNGPYLFTPSDEAGVNTVFRIAVDGGAVTPFPVGGVATRRLAGMAWSEALGRIFYSDRDGQVTSRDANGQNYVIEVSGFNYPEDVEIDGSDLLVAEENGNTLWRVRDGVKQAIAGIEDIVGVAVDAEYFYAVSQAPKQIIRIPRAAPATKEVIAENQVDPIGICVNSTTIFWTLIAGQVVGLAK